MIIYKTTVNLGIYIYTIIIQYLCDITQYHFYFFLVKSDIKLKLLYQKHVFSHKTIKKQPTISILKSKYYQIPDLKYFIISKFEKAPQSTENGAFPFHYNFSGMLFSDTIIRVLPPQGLLAK